MNISVTKSIQGQKDLVDEVIASFAQKGRILDIGTGSGLAARSFFSAGWDVLASGMDMEAYLDEDQGGFPEGIELLPDLDICDMQSIATSSLDCVWCAHVLEHVSDTGRALGEIRRVLKPDGHLFIAVPPFKHQVVGGHVNSGWNLGTLMYVLADAGFDLSEGRFIHHGYNLFGIAQRGPGPLPKGALHRANGDLETLRDAGRFPKGFDAKQRFEGQLTQVNWKWNTIPEQVPVSRKTLRTPPPIAKMRIAFFVPWITKGRGGTENVGQMMANAMARRGHAVMVLTFDDDKQPSRWELDPSINLVHLSEADTERNHQQMLLEVARWNPSVLVGLHMNRSYLRYVRCAGKLGLPLVLSEHSEPTNVFDRGTNSKWERELAFTGATRIHLVNPSLLDDLPKFIADKTKFIPNTVNQATQLAEPAGSTGRKVLLCVARLVPRKNLSVLLRAFATAVAKQPEWHLQIVGGGPELESLQKLTSSLRISKNVEFVGHQDNVARFYQNAHLFTLPSVSEVFGLVTLEAMAHGLPVVAMRTSIGASLLVENEKTGLLSSGPFGLGSYPEDLERLMSNSDLRSTMGQNAIERYRQFFAPDIVEDQWEELISEAVENKRTRARPTAEDYLTARVDDLIFGDMSRVGKS